MAYIDFFELPTTYHVTGITATIGIIVLCFQQVTAYVVMALLLCIAAIVMTLKCARAWTIDHEVGSDYQAQYQNMRLAVFGPVCVFLAISLATCSIMEVNQASELTNDMYLWMFYSLVAIQVILGIIMMISLFGMYRAGYSRNNSSEVQTGDFTKDVASIIKDIDDYYESKNEKKSSSAKDSAGDA